MTVMSSRHFVSLVSAGASAANYLCVSGNQRQAISAGLAVRVPTGQRRRRTPTHETPIGGFALAASNHGFSWPMAWSP
jgi:hypothetical protein